MTKGQDQQTNIGVFVCECGDKIASRLDVPALSQQAGALPGVAWAGQAGYWCTPVGLERMRQVIAEYHLERVVIAGCAPRTHEAHFRRALGGVNPTLVSVVNLRDLCAQPHQDDPAAIPKARDQVAMAVAELAARQPGAPRVAHITPHAVVIGGGIAGMTAALGLSDAGISVTLIERHSDLGGLARLQPVDRETAALAEARVAAVRARTNIEVLTDTQVSGLSGPVGCYRIALSSECAIEAGVIVVATGGTLDSKFQISNFKFQTSHPSSAQSPIPNIRSQNYAFVLCDMTPEKVCLHECCLKAFRQAAEIKRQDADSQATIFFRELYTVGGTYNELVWEAQRLGVNFVRYPAGCAPQSVGGAIATRDELTGRDVSMPCDQVINITPMTPQKDAPHLAKMLRLPVDAAGFLADARVRIRPSDRIERGIYVCGAAHYPCDAARATFEACSAAARAAQHIQRKQITSWSPPAVIDAARCNGCGDCVKVCPFMAVALETRPAEKANVPPLAVVDPLVCTGCGNCVSVCPVKAAQVATTYDEQIEAQIQAALGKETSRQGNKAFFLSTGSLSTCLLVFACEWSGYSAAEIAGAQQLAYPAFTRIIRLNCTGRLQPGLILKALELGAAGVLVLGCAPGVCHFEQGNERCAAVFEQANALAHLLAMDHRLKLEWIPPDDGARFVQVVNDFVAGIRDHE